MRCKEFPGCTLIKYITFNQCTPCIYKFFDIKSHENDIESDRQRLKTKIKSTQNENKKINKENTTIIEVL